MSTKQARFMGRMAASLSHDLCNVLATIQQASGLLSDYLGLARKESLKSLGLRPQFKYHDKFGEILGHIQAQVDRGQDLCEGLSRLAHAPDEAQPPVELGGACVLIAGLSARHVKRAKTTLEVTGVPERVCAKATLIDVLALLGDALGCVLDAAQGMGPVRLTPGTQGLLAYVDITCQGLKPSEAKRLAEMLAREPLLHAGIEAVDGGVRLTYALAANT